MDNMEILLIEPVKFVVALVKPVQVVLLVTALLVMMASIFLLTNVYHVMVLV
jgi:hypothetical protein